MEIIVGIALQPSQEVEQPTFLLSAKDQGSVNMCHKISFIMIHFCFGTYIFGSKVRTNDQVHLNTVGQ